MKKFTIKSLFLAAAFVAAPLVSAADYKVDVEGAHAFIEFKIKHLGYSWLVGRFNTFDGGFSYDEKNPADSNVHINIDTTSIDSNHAERDKHLRSKDFLNVKNFPNAEFVSTSFTDLGDGKATLSGNLTLMGVTKPVSIAVSHIGEGDDPWGGYRSGFDGTLTIHPKEFGIASNFISPSTELELYLGVEGIRQ